jgi:hypothetical protein
VARDFVGRCAAHPYLECIRVIGTTRVDDADVVNFHICVRRPAEQILDGSSPVIHGALEMLTLNAIVAKNSSPNSESSGKLHRHSEFPFTPSASTGTQRRWLERHIELQSIEVKYRVATFAACRGIVGDRLTSSNEFTTYLQILHNSAPWNLQY